MASPGPIGLALKWIFLALQTHEAGATRKVPGPHPLHSKLLLYFFGVAVAAGLEVFSGVAVTGVAVVAGDP